jgi:phytoene synthase
MSQITVVPAALREDLAWCEMMIRQHSGSFYRAFKQLPPEKAQAVFVVYAFCRLADDSVDVDRDPAALDKLETKLNALTRGEAPDEPLWRALDWAFQRFGLDAAPFYEMIEGQRRDLSFVQPATRQDLLDYCYYVAGTVGLMLLPLLTEQQTPDVRQTAIELGLAMQLSNILRDLGSDYRIGRIYLPADELSDRCVAGTDLGELKPTPALRRYWTELAHDALDRYAVVMQNIRLFSSQARLPVLLALLYYSHITRLGLKQPDRILARRMVVPDWVKLVLLVKARWITWRLSFAEKRLK